jgi:hypothetical protein
VAVPDAAAGAPAPRPPNPADHRPRRPCGVVRSRDRADPGPVPAVGLHAGSGAGAGSRAGVARRGGAPPPRPAPPPGREPPARGRGPDRAARAGGHRDVRLPVRPAHDRAAAAGRRARGDRPVGTVAGLERRVPDARAGANLSRRWRG